VISTADKIRVAMAPVPAAIGVALIVQFVRGAREPLVLVLGGLFVAYGVYRVALVRRALARKRAS
jgi:hypothetical protein